MDEYVGTHAYILSLLGPLMTIYEYEMFMKFLKLKPHVFVSESEDAYEFIQDCYKRLHKLSIIHKHGEKFMTF